MFTATAAKQGFKLVAAKGAPVLSGPGIKTVKPGVYKVDTFGMMRVQDDYEVTFSS